MREGTLTTRGGLGGPSRRITVIPTEQPEPVTLPQPAERPAEQPDRVKVPA
jgi:hypothetical protein